MRFRITPHAGHNAPSDAAEQLLASLAGRRSEARFSKVGSEIRVTWGREEGGWDRQRRQELEREELLELIAETCRRADPRLNVDWYAIGPLD